MGVSNDVQRLQGKAKAWDPGARAREANARMAALTRSMAAIGAAAGAMPGRASVTAVRATGMVIDDEPVLRLDLLVMADGRPPFPSAVEGPVSTAVAARLVPGVEVNVTFDPANPWVAAIDWSSL